LIIAIYIQELQTEIAESEAVERYLKKEIQRTESDIKGMESSFIEIAKNCKYEQFRNPPDKIQYGILLSPMSLCEFLGWAKKPSIDGFLFPPPTTLLSVYVCYTYYKQNRYEKQVAQKV
jgi:hypothetical protein